MRIKIQLSSKIIALIDTIRIKRLEENVMCTNGEAVMVAFDNLEDDEIDKLNYAKLVSEEEFLLEKFIRMTLKERDFVSTLNLTPETLAKLNRVQLLMKNQLTLNRVKKSYAIKQILLAYLLKSGGELEEYLV